MAAIDKPEILKIEKGSYKDAARAGLTFSEHLEVLDPSSQYTGTGLDKLDAFQRQLVAHDIRATGGSASLVQDFMRTDASKVLYPEFLNRSIRLGMEKGRMAAILTDVVSATTTIDGNTYKSLEVDLSKTDLQLKRVGESTKFPVGKFKTKETSIVLEKIGLKIEVSYEATRRAKLPIISNAFQLLGFRFAQDIVFNGIDVLINGDGNANPASLINAAAAGTITWADLLNLDMAFDNFESDMWIGNKNTLKKIMSITEFKDPLIGAEFHKTGTFITPFGNVLKINKNIPDGKLVAFNRMAGLELIEERGGSLVEVDKAIDDQVENTVISKVLGFSKMMSDSAFVLSF